MLSFNQYIQEGLSNSEIRYMPGRKTPNISSGEHIWKHDEKHGWHVRDPKGNVVHKSSETNSYKAKEEVKAKAAELNKNA